MIKRPQEVQDAIYAAEDAGDFELSGYLSAPGLKEFTGDSLEEMVVVCKVLKATTDNLMHHSRTDGVERWIKEQLEKRDGQLSTQ